MAAPYNARFVRPVISTSSATLKATAGDIYWITISNDHATDSSLVTLDDGGTGRWGVDVETIKDRDVPPFHAIFEPPIRCDTDIGLNITGGTVQVTVGFA